MVKLIAEIENLPKEQKAELMYKLLGSVFGPAPPLKSPLLQVEPAPLLPQTKTGEKTVPPPNQSSVSLFFKKASSSDNEKSYCK